MAWWGGGGGGGRVDGLKRSGWEWDEETWVSDKKRSLSGLAWDAEISVRVGEGRRDLGGSGKKRLGWEWEEKIFV